MWLSRGVILYSPYFREETMSSSTLNLESFHQKMAEGHPLAVIKFSSTTCMPCKTMHPVWEAFDKTRPDIAKYEVDVNGEMEIAGFFNVRSVPTILFVENQQVLYSFVGVTPLRDLEFVTDNIDDPHFREHGEFQIEKKKDHFFLFVVILIVAIFLGLFIFL